MFTARIENSGGEVLTLTQQERDFQVISIEGLNPPPATINLTNIAGMDGSKFNSSKLDTREIVITLKINGDGSSVEDVRQMLYQFFRTKDLCTFYFKNQNRDVKIQGYVKTVEVVLFSDGETMQVAVLCPDPYFRAVQEIITDISNEVFMFYFPFAIDEGDPIPFTEYINNRETIVMNASESETGVVIQIDCKEDIEKVEVKNTRTGESIILAYAFLQGDRITVNTNSGQKRIQLLRDGVVSNIFSALQKNSTFFQLAVGENPFAYLVNDGAANEAVTIKFFYTNAYRGV